jgi:hypothetical protein
LYLTYPFCQKLLCARSFISLHAHLDTESKYLLVTVQSAYRPFHSSKTALLKVVNNLLVSVDEKDEATVIAYRAAFTFLTIRFLLFCCLLDFVSLASLLFGFDPTSLIEVNHLVCAANFYPLFCSLLVSQRALSSVLYCTTYTPTRFMIYLLVAASLIINMLMTIKNIYRFGSLLMMWTNVGLSLPCWPALLKLEDGVRLTG